MTSPLKRIGLALFATATLTLAGCQTASTGPNTDHSQSLSPSPANPKDALIAAVNAITTASHDFVLGGGDDAAGSADPAKRLLSAHPIDPNQVGSIVLTAGKIYLKLDLGDPTNEQAGIDPTKFIEIDLALIPPTSSLGRFDMSDGDGLGIAQLIREGLVDATRTGHDFAGHLDFNKLTGPLAVKSEELAAAGEKAKSVPVTATVDDQGRVLTLKIDTTSVANEIGKDLSLEMTVSNYGSGAPITVPTGSEVVVASAKFLDYYLSINQ